MARVVVSSVAKSMSLAITSEPDKQFKRVDFPALVYPAMAAHGVPCFSRSLRRVPRCFLTSANSLLHWSMRVRAKRRSTSICCSPMPRAAPPPPLPPPAPPPSRSRCPHIRASLGKEYCIRARSTCSRASRVCARWEKISRITSSRSITQILASSSQFLCCDGRNMLSNTMQSHSCAFARSTISSALPVPHKNFLCRDRV